ncbi:MAG: hypothetical protein AABX07_00815 [Nanoarchaeota archaeon]
MKNDGKIRFAKKLVFWSFVVFIISVLLFLSLRSFFFGGEDNWIKDSRGVYIKHGNPAIIPQEVENQQRAIDSAIQIYNSKKIVGMNFSSQCLGTITNYALDIVNAPRIAEDNLPENQCDDFKTGKVTHFIELDKNGEIVRIA